MKKFGIKIDVDTSAFDKFVKDFEKGLQPEGFDEWANRVSRTAKELCNDPIANVLDCVQMLQKKPLK
jgi:hypothetical protein